MIMAGALICLIRPVLKLQLKVANATNDGKTQKMLTLFVAITMLKNLETFDSTVNVLNSNPIPGQIAVKKFL